MQNLLLAAAITATTVAATAHASVLNQWNLVVFNDLQSTSEVEGRALVGGNLTGSASNYGTMLLPRSTYLGTDVLLVGGNINVGNLQVEAGNLRLGGTRTGNANFNGGGIQIADAGASVIASAAQNELLSNSAFLRTLSPTNTVTLPNGQPAGVTFNAVSNQDGVAVFNVSGTALLSSNLVQQIGLNMNSATSVIINVSGTNISYNGGNMVGGMNAGNASKILWNFYEATTLSVDRQLFGAVLAPLAHLTNSTTIVGSTVARSFTQNGEVHVPTYGGYIPTPGSLAALSLAGLAAMRRRR